jgi:hypothetical protein
MLNQIPADSGIPRFGQISSRSSATPIGGQINVVEADETFIGGRAKNRAYAKKEPKKYAVMTLVDRDGESRSFHVANVKAKTLQDRHDG